MTQMINQSIIIIFIIVVWLFLYFLSPILTPFFIAALFAYLGAPLVYKLRTRLKFPQSLSVLIVFLLFFAIIILFVVLMIPLIHKQINALIEVFPKMVAWVQDTMIPWFVGKIGASELIDTETLKTSLASMWGKVGGVAGSVAKTLIVSGMTIITWLMYLLIIPVVTFYLLRDWDKMIISARDFIPRSYEKTTVKLVRECDMVLSGFFRGQLLVMISLATIYATGLSLMGLDIGLMIGLISGLISFVPYLGFIFGIVVASIAALVQFGTIKSVIMVILVYMTGQLADTFFLTPYLIGDRIGLHPVIVMFAVLAGGYLFGFVGVLVALPFTAVLMVWLRYLHQRYRASELYK